MEILFLLVLILLNGMFAMSEIALVTARRARLSRLAENGDHSAAVAIKLGEDPTRFLSTIQIGITSIGVLSGIVGEAALAVPLSRWMQELGLEQRFSDISSTVVVVAAITYLAIVVGELVPKRIGQMHPEVIARLVARPIHILAVGTRPFVQLLASSTMLLLRVLRQHDNKESPITEEEIHAMLHEGSEAGVIEKTEHEMVRNVFRLDERRIGSLMIPRSDLIWLDVERPWAANRRILTEAGYSSFPVCRGGLSEILGVVTMRQIANQALTGSQVSLTSGLEPPVFVPSSLTGMELLEKFRASNCPMMFVVDEYGDLQGVVFLHDLLESVIGEFQPGEAEEPWAIQREDGSWLLDGLIPTHELRDTLGFRGLPDEEKARYHTLSGMMMWLLGNVPKTADVAEWKGWRLEVVDLDGKRIDKVLACRVGEEDSEAADSAH